jgi:predicted amidophosphoribosyltransferase
VRAWKEQGLRRLAPLAAELVAGRIARPAADVITYIPPDPVRQLTRSCHPAESLAHGLGERWEVDVQGLLARTRAAERQASLPRARRRANVQGSFRAVGEAPQGVVLVDDIYTTGATAGAAATALRAAGAGRVDVITFARAVR